MFKENTLTSVELTSRHWTFELYEPCEPSVKIFQKLNQAEA
jgi:hypothetical protein